MRRHHRPQIRATRIIAAVMLSMLVAMGCGGSGDDQTADQPAG
jgi:hypothetical protein